MEVTTTTPKLPEDDTNNTDFGDFASNDDEEVDVEEGSEPWHNYDPEDNTRVFYPICLGQLLHERYLVEHKLGHGGFSTVWMAHDVQSKTEVALKVMSLGTWADNEARIQEEIVRCVQDTSHLVTYLDTFLLPRDHGHHHRVLVLPLMGPYLSWRIMTKISMAARMSAAQQLLGALETLHKAGIIHRDLNDRNCMWGTSNFHNVARSARYEALGRPLKRPIPHVSLWKQGELVRSVVVPENLRTDKFYLGDFGLATKPGDPTFEVQRGYPPSAYCSPERLHGKVPSSACDMWSYMVLFGQLYLDFPPFRSLGEGGIISSWVRALGPLPEEWKALCKHPEFLDSWYDQNHAPAPETDLASIIAFRRPDVDPAERELVRSIMLKGFTYSPEKRLTATELLHDAQFRALMDRYDCRDSTQVPTEAMT